jgi:hypothetical protein
MVVELHCSLWAAWGAAIHSRGKNGFLSCVVISPMQYDTFFCLAQRVEKWQNIAFSSFFTRFSAGKNSVVTFFR